MSYTASTIPVSDPRGTLILDTGPIRELVTYHAVNYFKFERLRPELKYFVDDEKYGSGTEFLASFRRKVTSASVVAELYGWIYKTDPTGRIQLWKRVYEEFESMSVDEDMVKLLDMDVNLVAKYGPTDVSLLNLAHRNLHQRPTILTIDSRLLAECKKAQISSSSLLEVCSGR